MFNFKTLSFGLLFAGLGSVTAQTAPGFPVSSSSQSLRITYGTNIVSPAGELIPRAGKLSLLFTSNQWSSNQICPSTDTRLTVSRCFESTEHHHSNMDVYRTRRPHRGRLGCSP
jgi:hypothetical protein